MNTKQKLTLGIAAIFMVTLTIVGVTYAYFVTQVQTGTEAKVDVSTATFGEVSFVKEKDSITLNSMAENESETLLYSVTNNGDSALSYDNVLRRTEATDDIKFIKSLTSKDAQPLADCYNLAEGATAPGACYTGSFYDNVSVVITRYTKAEDRTNKANGVEVYNGKLQSIDSIDIEDNVPIAAQATHYYTITVTHDNAGKNQNLEQGAKVTVIPDIASVDAITNEPA